MQNKYQKPTGSYISFMSNKVKTTGGINFAQGIPGFDPPKELTDILGSIAGNKIHQYAPGSGNEELLSLLVKKHHKHFPFTKDDFLIVQGATEALSLIFTYLNNEINGSFSALAFDPVYESYKYLPGIFNKKFVTFSFEKNGSVDFKWLREVCETQNVHIIFVASPGNPFGKIWSKKDMQELVKLSNELEIYLIIDAVYQELYFDTKPYIPIEKFNEYIFYVNSFSKTFSITGWRIGYLAAHQEHMQKIKSIHDYIGLCAPSVLQEAIVQYCKKFNFGEKYIQSVRDRLTENYLLVSTELTKLGFTIPKIKGGYFVWAELPDAVYDGFKFAIDLYDEQKVAVIPGEHFSDKAKGFIRINIAREKAEIIEGLERIKLFFAEA
ncbi:MAG: pyridoxal phosphate-dependent aminotransferase [Bacteroidales bacterium]|jgi:aspartate/methionine/tyrosine aminotransferase|nr:pyridoxal phosphate-dependent aminotransferase [Bacteroidales bacterium]